MESQSVSRANMYRTDQWQSLVGETVEVRFRGELYRKGSVDAAMPDASGLWIAPEGAFQREFIDAASGFEIWTSLYPRSRWDGTAASEMATEAAEVREQMSPRPGDAGRTLTSLTHLAPVLPMFVIHPDEEQMQSITDGHAHDHLRFSEPTRTTPE